MHLLPTPTVERSGETALINSPFHRGYQSCTSRGCTIMGSEVFLTMDQVPPAAWGEAGETDKLQSRLWHEQITTLHSVRCTCNSAIVGESEKPDIWPSASACRCGACLCFDGLLLCHCVGGKSLSSASMSSDCHQITIYMIAIR